MNQAPYQLLTRHPDLLTANTLILTSESETDPAWLAMVRSAGCRVQTWDWRCYQVMLAALGEDKVTFAIPEVELPDNTERVIIVWPKAKQLAIALVQMLTRIPAHRHLPEVWLVGSNDSGGKSINNAIKHLADTMKHDSARRCSLWSALLRPQQTSFNWLALAKATHYDGRDYLSLPGVFSQGSLDKGSELLLAQLKPLHGNVLDLGCGSGLLGISQALRSTDINLTLADTDAFALRSSALNAARMGVKADIVASDGLGQVNGYFDTIISNPPFHAGKETDYQFAEQLFANARKQLRAGGKLWIVANRHLPYEEWAARCFSQVEEVATANGFKILRISH
ncbi:MULTISPECIES: class I SAM-dependent methyltransferase [unclassified Oceanobacter]|uniref:class I SAM-dependent methyltransferase n=2 Tax=Gammaproteobacteria TaxID=1236 RepID=UPI002732B3A4|nr:MULTISPECIES: class I SAM-dependent methyltransferase [unclassified Oceanobacter]MDP2608220.1 class I SAM-dependent methyltransferase [Oceanobacter sp. 1_MG-2023]MDP2612946.1 class I SAM-dependent methyltransferase [Oceanobacter sp. 2_MG-2023]